MLKNEKDRYQIEDTKFDRLFSNFKDTNEVAILMSVTDPIFSKEDMINIKRSLEESYSDLFSYYKNEYKDEYEEKYKMYHEEALRFLEIHLMREEIFEDRSISLVERSKKARLLNYRPRIYIDPDDAFFYQDIYAYELKKLAIEKYKVNDKNLSNITESFAKHMPKLKEYIHKYTISLSDRSILHPFAQVTYYLRVNKHVKDIFINEYNDGERLAINDIYLFKDDKLLFAYSYKDLMYKISDGDWEGIGGTLAN